MFDLQFGIDYSGRKTPVARTPALQVFAAGGSQPPYPVHSPTSTTRRSRAWCRKEVAEWLIEQAHRQEVFICGIDHAFSFPLSYFKRHGLKSWGEFLGDFCEHWPCDQDEVTVDCIRHAAGGPPSRTGTKDEFRLTDRWTSSAKSVFLFDVQGQVAKSTHAGIPWLWRIKEAVGERVHFWPFDGWEVPPGRSVIAEVYPSLFRKRYPQEARTADQQDAYASARWLRDMDRHGFLERYFNPPLTEAERTQCRLEGWILGVM